MVKLTKSKRSFHDEKIGERPHRLFRLLSRLGGRREGPTRRGLDDEQRRRAAFGLGQGGREDFKGVVTGPEAEAGLPTSVEAQTRQQAEAVELTHDAGDARTSDRIPGIPDVDRK